MGLTGEGRMRSEGPLPAPRSGELLYGDRWRPDGDRFQFSQSIPAIDQASSSAYLREGRRDPLGQGRLVEW